MCSTLTLVARIPVCMCKCVCKSVCFIFVWWQICVCDIIYTHTWIYLGINQEERRVPRNPIAREDRREDTSVHTCMHSCMRACMCVYICSYMHAFVHACVYVCVHTCRNQDNIPKKCMDACRMKLTVSDKPRASGMALSSFFCSYKSNAASATGWHPTHLHTGGYFPTLLWDHHKTPSKEPSSQCFDLLPTCCCNQHIWIAQMMTMTWIKSECIVTVFALRL